MTPEAFVDGVARLSRQGKLPGFERRPAEDQSARSFRVLAFGGVFDHELCASVRPAPSGAGGVLATFSLRVLRKTPAILLGVLALTLWPGLPLTDSMLRLTFGWYDRLGVQTWWWYLPLWAISLPPLRTQWKRARAEARADALKQIEKIAGAVRG
ncbi:MAG TPA: hypothetical protein DEB06_06000 [Phycisphaerales bacterium]|nr:hypothetical protein [Phycisphaerales bacterium]